MCACCQCAAKRCLLVESTDTSALQTGHVDLVEDDVSVQEDPLGMIRSGSRRQQLSSI